MFKLSKGVSLSIVLLSYVVAFIVCLLLYRPVLAWTNNVILAFFVLDVIATVIVWASGLICQNASLYDPYWSIVPIIMAVFFVITVAPQISAVVILYLFVLAFWGFRLTVNWIVDWPGLVHQDWRYTMLKEKNPKLYPLTNFFGINMIPTLFVFAGMIPAFLAITYASTINALTIIGVVIC